GRLEVWLKRATPSEKVTTVTVICRAAPTAAGTVTFRPNQLRWESGPASRLAVLTSTRSGRVESVQTEGDMQILRGPWPDPVVVGAYIVPAQSKTTPAIVVKTKRVKQ